MIRKFFWWESKCINTWKRESFHAKHRYRYGNTKTNECYRHVYDFFTDADGIVVCVWFPGGIEGKFRNISWDDWKKFEQSMIGLPFEEAKALFLTTAVLEGGIYGRDYDNYY